jgi:hypothetical protein
MWQRGLCALINFESYISDAYILVKLLELDKSLGRFQMKDSPWSPGWMLHARPTISPQKAVHVKKNILMDDLWII